MRVSDQDSAIFVIFQQTDLATVRTEPEMLHGMGVRRTSAFDRKFWKSKDVPFPIHKRG
jgi:hypothetical protein